MFGKIKFFLSTLALSLMVSFSVNAADGLEKIAERGNTAALAFQDLAVSAIYLAGIVIFGMGCWFLYKDQKEEGRGHGKTGFVALLVGAGLLAAPSLANLFAGTLTGNDTDFTIKKGTQGGS
ncbi:hypothetical protein [Ferrimonas marina]|uniref:TrbC/VIRB2 family protein n=1 Tax=Ferrimonas marina TaxID=299255 RepID=A0A1M5TIE0_9GAMM|nr:hypothetical protein [Ferrimonas marina]SHH50448.1 hypothetical protein SAMN02745129_2156 [Ferrimonas marina]